MTLSDWLKDNDCNDEQRAEWTVQLAQLLPQCKDGHLNPERIDVDETGNGLSLNNSSIILDEYSAPELLKDDEARSFQRLCFFTGLSLMNCIAECLFSQKKIGLLKILCSKRKVIGLRRLTKMTHWLIFCAYF